MVSMLRILVAGFGLMAVAGLASAAEPMGPSRLITQADVIGITVKQTLLAAAKSGNGPFDITTAEAIEKFYDQHDNLPIWVDGQGFTEKAKQVVAELRRASDWGLAPADYAVSDVAPGTPSIATLAQAELALTRAVVNYAHDAHVGRFDPQRISELIDLMSTPPNATAVLSGLSSAKEPAKFLADFNPHHPEFAWLRQKYLSMRTLEPEPVLERIPEGLKLRPGDVSADIPLIRKRLHVTLAVDANAQLYDDALAAAVKDFEDAHGFHRDGLLTPAVRRLLNQRLIAQPAKSSQVDKILANMERWRWLPEDLGKKYVFDNIPEFLTRVVNDGQIVHQAKIVVGKPDTPTAIFSNSLKYVEFHPFWRIPDSIKVKELLPAIASGGSGAIARRGLKMATNGKEVNPSTVDFGSTDIRAFEFFQPPGPANALGDVKFMFPNHYDIYMHDTPAKDLFADNVRAFSHGCMRVQDPKKFAEVVMEAGSGWSPEKVRQQFADMTNQQIPLDKPLPVHVVYFTVRPAADGQLTFIDDVYGHDRRVTLALAGKWSDVSKQLAPKSTVDPTLMAGIRGDGYGSSAALDSGTFLDIFGNPTAPPKKHGRGRHRIFVFGAANSGFVDNAASSKHSAPANDNFFAKLFGLQ